MKWSALIVCLTGAIVAMNELQQFRAVSCNSSTEDLLADQQVAADEDSAAGGHLFGFGLGLGLGSRPASGGQADRIRWLLRRYLQLPEPAPSYSRIQTRSAAGDQRDALESRKQSAQAILDKWLESTIFELTKKSVKDGSSALAAATSNSMDAKDALDVSASSNLLSTGYKMARNYQPVMMRLPPRFGKRSLGFK